MSRVRVFAELPKDAVVTVPDWVQTEEDMENFVLEFAKQNIIVNYEPVQNSLGSEEFVEKVSMLYQNALIRGHEDIVIIAESNAGKTYIIHETNDGFCCDEVGCRSDDIEDMAYAVWFHKTGDIVSVSDRMDRLTAEKYVINNIDTRESMYMQVKDVVRLHVYTKEEGVRWYYVDIEISQFGEYVVDSTMSACNMDDLRRAIGISWNVAEKIHG